MFRDDSVELGHSTNVIDLCLVFGLTVVSYATMGEDWQDLAVLKGLLVKVVSVTAVFCYCYIFHY